MKPSHMNRIHRSMMRFFPLVLVGSIFVGGCSDPGDTPPNGSQDPGPTQPPEMPGSNTDDSDPTTDPLDVVWSDVFDTESTGVLSAVWGSSPDDVFVVGGEPSQGEVYHFDGTQWREMSIPNVPLLVWVFGFEPDDVGTVSLMAVGVGGGVIRYDGASWTRLESGTTKDLWGVWGQAPDDMWIVGGGDGEAVILHFDGSTFAPTPLPDNDRDAESLFKVWGIGSKIFAVGENGLIIQYEGGGDTVPGQWFQVFAGADADDDFVSLWGTSDDNIVAVGGRSSARIAVYDGSAWTTRKLADVPGLTAVSMIDPDRAIVGGLDGYVGSYDPSTGVLTNESAPTTLTVHAIWAYGGDSVPAGRAYGVGGQFFEPYTGLALVRTLGDPGIDPVPPLEPLAGCSQNADCANGYVCDDGACKVESPCPGGDDLDSDQDGVADACDVCPGFDDNVDSDGDSVPDGCDVCSGFDDHDDADGDNVPDGCDLCAGGDDSLDSDQDGVADFCDACPGFDDNLDQDGDSVPDGCDVCSGFVDADDADSDGVPDGCDVCADADDTLDSDGDGVPNACDACEGFDDSLDSDGDGVPNGCDSCEGSPADLNGNGVVNAEDLAILLGAWGPNAGHAADFNMDGSVNAADLAQLLGLWGPVDSSSDNDGDGVPDACDICAGSDDQLDADGDGTPDGCDVCPGGNDALDADSDGVPDACDMCPSDNPNDSDGDGVCDSDDICPGGDDNLDSDGDGVPDFCDICPSDNPDDSDGDGVCDSDDLCPGFDDNVDSDGNGVPDGCCLAETDCELGENCDTKGFCVPASEPDLEIGVGGGELGCVDGPYSKLPEGGELPLCEGFQGFIEMWLSLRVTGFAPQADVKITRRLSLATQPCTKQADCEYNHDCLDGLCTPQGEGPTIFELDDAGNGVGEIPVFLYIIFKSSDFLDGQQVVLSITVEDQANPSIIAMQDLNLVLFVKRLCFVDDCPDGPFCVDCPEGQVCVDGFCGPQ